MLGHASPDPARRRASLNAARLRAEGYCAVSPCALPSPTNSPRPTLIAAVAEATHAIAPRKGWPAGRVKLSRRAWAGEPPGGECPPQSDGARRPTKLVRACLPAPRGSRRGRRGGVLPTAAATAPKSHLRRHLLGRNAFLVGPRSYKGVRLRQIHLPALPS